MESDYLLDDEDLSYIDDYSETDLNNLIEEFEHIEDSEYANLKNCLISSTVQVYPFILQSVIVNLCFCFLHSFFWKEEVLYHYTSIACGLYVLIGIETLQGKIIIVACIIFSYSLLWFCNSLYKKFDRNSRKYYVVTILFKCALISCLVLSEFFLIDPEVWMQIRGPIMVFSMKLISLIDDLDGSIAMPGIESYLGYCFCSANIIFGPWVSFNSYLKLYRKPTKKNLSWLWGILRAVCYSLLFLTISNCWGTYFISEFNSNIWLRSYREALSFRTSHYFISFLSEATMLSAGFKESNQWRYTVSNPFPIEFPTALPIVVTEWNKPMHQFLKKYVYKPCSIRFGQGIAMVTTFVISSFLHGFEIKVSVVLITIGTMAYLQYRVRKTLSNIFNMCFQVHPCKDSNNCAHDLKRNHIYTRLMIFLYSILTVIHLIFLGVLMDPSTVEIGIIEKWRRLSYIGLWLGGFDFIIANII